ncbi:acyltransferase family protein [Acidisoma sp.]|uniref:acyltransferase family protein n=1 Tax=Acidisoma sp. TaxID=1872115 RepID=UPI003B00F684
MSEAAAAPLRHQNLPLTSIRGFAALWVVGHHLQFVLAYAGYDAAGWLFRPGYVAVDIFFVLSGFVITAVHRDLTLPGLRDFFLRRIFRVYPLHLFVLALILGLWVWSEARFGNHDPTERLRDLPIVVLLLQPYLLHGLTWNTVSWSIGVELLCYVLFPLVIGAMRRLEFVGCVLILLMMAAIERHVQSDMVWGWPAVARGLAGFGLGMAVQQMTVLVRRPRPRTASLIEAAALLAILLAVLGDHLRLIPVFAAVLIWGLAAECGVIARGLGAGWCVWLGRISFSLYLIHPTLIGLAFVWLPPGRLGLGHAADGMLWTLLMLALLLGLATITWATVEEPARRFGIRLAKRRAGA